MQLLQLTFAITVAFTALSRAAQAEQTIAGLNTLASQFGLVGTEVAESLDRITKGQLNAAEVYQQANLAISAGLGTRGAYRSSFKACIGRTSSDSFQRIIRGVGKLEPELLDELVFLHVLNRLFEDMHLRQAANQLVL